MKRQGGYQPFTTPLCASTKHAPCPGPFYAAKALYEDNTVTKQDIVAAREELLRMWRLLVPVSSAQVDPAEEQARQAHMEAVYGLAELLSEVCDAVDPQTYKSTAYAALAEMVDAAYDVLTKEESSTQELVDAKVNVKKALELLNGSGKRIQISVATVSGLKNLIYNGKALKQSPWLRLATSSSSSAPTTSCATPTTSLKGLILVFYAYTYACRSKALTLVNSALP